jgi:hypothetical protein
MTRRERERRLADVAAASAAVLAERWPTLVAMSERRRYAALRLHVEAALVAYMTVPGLGDPLWEPRAGVPEPSPN